MAVKRSRESIMNGLLVLLIFFLTLYAPIELSRVIVNWGLAPVFIFELTFMWLFYGLAVFIIALIVHRRLKQRQGNKERGIKMIKTVIRFQNMVMAFDTEGEQVPKYQGRYKDVKGDILRDALPDTVFTQWFNYDSEPETVSREEW